MRQKKQYEEKVKIAEDRLQDRLRSYVSADEEKWLKEKEMCKERLDKTESALKEKTVKLIEYLNREKQEML